mmetsp:Transcript_20297/g.23522  ORF Transcript_20297/g.23522 Transcript_20297/m.23522 type:complete len:380 (+) Transcript_20297:377-1516(+)
MVQQRQQRSNNKTKRKSWQSIITSVTKASVATAAVAVATSPISTSPTVTAFSTDIFHSQHHQRQHAASLSSRTPLHLVPGMPVATSFSSSSPTRLNAAQIITNQLSSSLSASELKSFYNIETSKYYQNKIIRSGTSKSRYGGRGRQPHIEVVNPHHDSILGFDLHMVSRQSSSSSSSPSSSSSSSFKSGYDNINNKDYNGPLGFGLGIDTLEQQQFAASPIKKQIASNLQQLYHQGQQQHQRRSSGSGSGSGGRRVGGVGGSSSHGSSGVGSIRQSATRNNYSSITSKNGSGRTSSSRLSMNGTTPATNNRRRRRRRRHGRSHHGTGTGTGTDTGGNSTSSSSNYSCCCCCCYYGIYCCTSTWSFNGSRRILAERTNNG